MNIFLRELRANFRSLIIWGVITVFYISIGFSKFSAYEGNPELLGVLDSLPPALLEAFNFSAFNLTTITGFFGVMFTYFALILSIAAVMWGSDIISKEERDKTVEFSLTLPIRRSQMITGKALAALVNCVLLVLITWGAVVFFSQSYLTTPAYFEFVRRGVAALFVLQVIFLAVGVFLGSAMKSYKRSGAVGIGILLISYFLSVIAGLSEDFANLKYVTPFKFFDPANILHDGQLDNGFLLISLGLVALLVFGAYNRYARRDLYI